MDKLADSLEAAYNEFVTAVAAVLETRAASNGERSAATVAAVENFNKKWEAFQEACDIANMCVDAAKDKLMGNITFPVNEDLVDIFEDCVVNAGGDDDDDDDDDNDEEGAPSSFLL